MSIHPESTSYPFLAIAQRHGVDYGVVLAYSDAARKLIDGAEMPEYGATGFDVWEQRAVRVLGSMTSYAGRVYSMGVGQEIVNATVRSMLLKDGRILP